MGKFQNTRDRHPTMPQRKKLLTCKSEWHQDYNNLESKNAFRILLILTNGSQGIGHPAMKDRDLRGMCWALTWPG